MLFVDQVDSTRLLAEIGDEAMVAVRRRLNRLMTDAVAANGGRVFGDMGDGLAAVFDTAGQAANASLDMQATAEATVDSEEPTIDLRVGLHHGEVVPNGDGFVGMSVHVTARLCDAAPTGHIAVSEAFCDELGDDPRAVAVPFERRVMKGIADPMMVRLLTDREHRRPLPPSVSTRRRWHIPSTPWLTERAAPRRMVGRQQELSQLDRLAAASEERIHLALIDGEPGIGKSSLLHRFGAECAREGRLCVVGRADETQPAPYREFLEALAHVVPHVPDAVIADHVLRHGHLLARLIPGLEHHAGVTAAGSDDQEPDRFRLFEAFADLFRSIATNQPVVLLVEDLHWSAEPSLALLHHLVRSLRLPSLLVVASFRPTEQTDDGPLASFLGRVGSDANVRRVRLGPLHLSDVEEMVADLSFAEVAEQLHAKTAGSPLFLTEMIRSFSESGEPQRSADGSLLVPDTVQELARTRVDRLGPGHRAVLADAAVLGNVFELSDVEGLAPAHIDVLQTLEEAEQAGVIATDPVGDDTFVFGHAVVRDALYQRISAPRRRRRHGAAADVILASGDERVRASAAEILRHIKLSKAERAPGLIADLAGWAAASAMVRLDLAEAVDYHRMVVDALESRSSPTTEQQVELIEARLKLAATQTAALRNRGRATYVQAADEARTIERWDLFSEAASGYGGQFKENQAILDVSEPAGLVAEALVHEPESTATRARLLTALAIWQRQHVPYDERRSLTDDALSIARSLGDKQVLAVVLAEVHRALHSPMSTEEALDASKELEQLAAELGDDIIALHAANLRVQVEFELGHWEETLEQATRLEMLANRVGTIEGKRVSLLWQATMASLQGDAARHQRLSIELNRLIAAFPASIRSIMLGASAMPLPWLNGHARALYELSEEFAPPGTKAMLAADGGDIERAACHVVEAGGPERVLIDQNYLFFQDAVGMVRAARRTGDTQLAAELYELLLPFAGRNARMGLVAFLGAVDHHLGSLAAVLGTPEAAIEHFDSALRAHRQMRARPWIALTLAEMVPVEVAVGSPDADAHRREATAIADELELGLVHEALAL